MVAVKRSVAAAGPADPNEAWERYAEIARWPTWAPPIQRVDASAARLAPGVTGVVHGLLGLRVNFVVEEVDELRRTWSWNVRSGPIRMALRHEVLPTADGGSATTLMVDGPAPLVLLYPEVARIALVRLVS
ncbi:MAG: SRPBCC family protein [Propionibacteriaceae bacterium]